MAEKGTTDFTAEDGYSERIARAKGGDIPVGGVPMPKIPRLDQPSADRGAGVQNPFAVLSPEQQEQLRKEGKLMPGVGSAYAANQPAPGSPAPAPPPGQVANPPRADGSVLRPETKEQLKNFEKAAQEEKSATDKTEAEVTAILEEQQFDNPIERMMKNRKRRDAIEARCEPLDIEQLLLHQELRQRVPIIPGRLEVTYRTLSAGEDLFLKRSMIGEGGSEQYVMDRYALKCLTAALYKVNSTVLPTHLDKDGVPNSDLFGTKLDMVMKFPINVILDLDVNYRWFSERVQDLLTVDKIKGF